MNLPPLEIACWMFEKLHAVGPFLDCHFLACCNPASNPKSNLEKDEGAARRSASLLSIYAKIPKLDVNPLVGSGRIGPDKRARVLQSTWLVSRHLGLEPSGAPVTAF